MQKYSFVSRNSKSLRFLETNEHFAFTSAVVVQNNNGSLAGTTDDKQNGTSMDANVISYKQ
jgi:hypothetical protein